MKLLAILLLFTIPLRAQETPAEAAKKFGPHYTGKQGGAFTAPKQSFLDFLRHHQEWTRVHLSFPREWGLHDPLFIWCNDQDDASLDSDPRIITLTPNGAEIEVKRGHLIFWNVATR